MSPEAGSRGPDGRTTTGLRVLAADEDRDALDGVAAVLRDLGHVVTAYAVDVREAARHIANEDPDATLVMLHEDDEHALALIEEIVEYATGPVIALLRREDPEFIARAARRGVFAYVHDVTPQEVQAGIEVAMRRHAEARALSERVDQLETALERRAVIERAKGILMERYDLPERAAFERLREHARSHNRRVVEVAATVVEGRTLFPRSDPRR